MVVREAPAEKGQALPPGTPFCNMPPVPEHPLVPVGSELQLEWPCTPMGEKFLVQKGLEKPSRQNHSAGAWAGLGAQAGLQHGAWGTPVWGSAVTRAVYQETPSPGEARCPVQLAPWPW